MRTIERVQWQAEDAEEAVRLSVPREPELPKPWSCEPCGSTNNDGSRMNCAYCGKVRR